MHRPLRALLTGNNRPKAGLAAGHALCAALFILVLQTASAARAEGAYYGQEGSSMGVPQRLSSEGESELRGLVASGSLAALQRPEFGEYRAELADFYNSAGYALTWVIKSRPTAKARIVIKRLQAADNEGLLAQDYDSPLWAERLEELTRSDPAPEPRLLRFDLAMTICAMRYSLDLHLGRINPRAFHPTFELEPDIRGPSDFLRKRILSAADVEEVFKSIEPAFPSYRRLVKAVQRYKELARQDDGEQLPVPETAVRPGDLYPGIPRLTRLLKLVGDLPRRAASRPKRYTRALAKAVKRFQRRHGLPPDGFLGEQTLRQLNIPLERRLRQLQLTLERWRWLPHRFSRPPILVNIPEFRLYAGNALSQKVVVGMAFKHETPVFVGQLTEVVLRPPWTVPMSIQLTELVPKMETDPSYLERNGFDVIDGKELLVSSGAVSAAVLTQLRDGKLYLRQRPGPHNSLGLVKFHMPNAYSVYIHGTPSRRGFWESERDLSHGCIRVEDPLALAAWVLRDQPEWTRERIRAAMEGSETVTVKLAEPVSVLLQYGTAAVKEGGEVSFFEDIYNRDAEEGRAFEERARLAAQ